MMEEGLLGSWVMFGRDHNQFARAAVLGLGLFFVILVLRQPYLRWRRWRQLSALPRLTVKWDDDNEEGWKEQLREASARYANVPFVLDMGGSALPQVILPQALLDEIRRRPDSLPSLRKDMAEMLQSHWTGVGADHPIAREVVRKELTNHIPQLLPAIQLEVQAAVGERIGAAHGDSLPAWAPRVAFPLSLDICSQVLGCFFVGPLCKSPEWRSLTSAWSRDLRASAKAVWRLPPFVRPLLARWLPECRRVAADKKEACRLLLPSIRTALAQHAPQLEGKRGDGAGGVNSLVGWMLNYVDTSRPVEEIGDIEGIEILIVGTCVSTWSTWRLLIACAFENVAAGSIDGTARTLTELLNDIATYPEYVQDLRAEIHEVLASEPDGILRMGSLGKLRKLDSFLAECLRFHPHFPSE